MFVVASRYELPGIHGLNFILPNSLGGGGVASLRSDPQVIHTRTHPHTHTHTHRHTRACAHAHTHSFIQTRKMNTVTSTSVGLCEG